MAAVIRGNIHIATGVGKIIRRSIIRMISAITGMTVMGNMTGITDATSTTGITVMGNMTGITVTSDMTVTMVTVHHLWDVPEITDLYITDTLPTDIGIMDTITAITDIHPH